MDWISIRLCFEPTRCNLTSQLLSKESIKEKQSSFSKLRVSFFYCVKFLVVFYFDWKIPPLNAVIWKDHHPGQNIRGHFSGIKAWKTVKLATEADFNRKKLALTASIRKKSGINGTKPEK